MESAEPAGPVWPFAWVTAAVAGLLAVPAVPNTPGWLDRLSLLVTGRPLAPAHAVVLALALALVARGVLLRRHAAWLGLNVLVTMGLLAVVTGDDALWRLPLLIAAFGVVWLRRAAFPVRPHHERVRTALRTGAILVIGAVLGSIVLGGVSIRSVGHDVAAGLGSFGSLDGPGWLPTVLGLVGGAGLLVLLVTLLAPDPAPPPGDEDERRRVAGLVAHPASDTLAPFALRRDKSYVFSPDGGAAIGYRVLFGVAVAGGDPVGDPRSHDRAVTAFLDLCRRTGWRPAVLGASAGLLPAWGGLRSFGFGDEVYVEPAEFDLSGRQMRNVRQAVKRTRNAGVTSEIVPERELPPDLREKLLEVAARSLGGAAERGFSMNLDELLTGYHPGSLVAVAYDAGGAPIAFQRYAMAGEGISLDAMRRAPGGPNGVNERLIVEMIEYARTTSAGVVSLNFAAFRELLDSAERRPLERAGYRALHLLDPLIAVESLYLFDKKFRPAYRPRSVVFRSWFDIAWLAAALLTLEFGRTRAPVAAEEAVTEPAGHLGRP
ncbi:MULTISPECIES: bifunctional lysylphosphatidylglycerol flippase/synthetase MprF [Thermomonosporaceae]|uniref:bifunctional lysylphosphatidylglycerol flippase/synthetase MprF n=1 Tax=Thermomonosporaceae TaxID=2012 RepID=UPI00255B076A|nr:MULTISPECIES: phosphatidylglycerol lysyltransferase domain-containing protein [Thermomonosporaceae]MDL4771527.1 phosphatidylglycerol lysyltransferase domain-containing protein [Actinomadura xylanilytica]